MQLLGGRCKYDRLIHVHGLCALYPGVWGAAIIQLLSVLDLVLTGRELTLVTMVLLSLMSSLGFSRPSVSTRRRTVCWQEAFKDLTVSCGLERDSIFQIQALALALFGPRNK